jgi:hypothetical protein
MTHAAVTRLLDGIELRERHLAVQADDSYRAPARGRGRTRRPADHGQNHPRHRSRPRTPTATGPDPAGRRCLPAAHGRLRPGTTAAACPRPGTRSPHPAQTRRRHPREIQIRGRSRVPRRDQTRIIHTAPPSCMHRPRRPGTLIDAKAQNSIRPAYCLSERTCGKILPACDAGGCRVGAGVLGP